MTHARGLPLGYRKEEADKYFRTPDGRPDKRQVSALLWAARDRLGDDRLYYMLALMYFLGLRIGEAVLLEWTHLGRLDAAGRPLFVRVPTLKKRQRSGAVPLLPVPLLSGRLLAADAFNRKRLSPDERAAGSPYLFPGRDPHVPMSDTHAHRLFVTARDIAQLNPLATPHALRHTAARVIASAFPIVHGDSEATMTAKQMRATAACRAFLRHSDVERDPTPGYMRMMGASDEKWNRLVGVLDLPRVQPMPGTAAAAEAHSEPV